MAFDPAWKNPQGKDLESLWRWAQDVTGRLRGGNYLPTPFSGAAADVTYDNTTSGLTAADVQAAIDENDGRLDTLEATHGWQMIASGAISAQATLDLAGFSGFDEIEIALWNLLPANTNDELYCRFSQSSSFLSGASDYAWAYLLNATRTNDDSDSEIEMLLNQSSAAGNLASFVIRLLRPNAGSFAKTMTFVGGYNASLSLVNGVGRLIANTNAIDGIRFGYLSGGNIASGFYAQRGIVY
jgi:hypothetical protein